MVLPAETILVADDEETVRSFIRHVLRQEGFNLLEAVDGVDAMELVGRLNTPVDLLLTDVRMPRMDGIALANALARVYPKLPVLYISGYPFEIEEVRGTRPGSICASLTKPFSRRALVEAVQKCLSPSKSAAGTGG